MPGSSIASVALPLPLDKTLSYRIPPQLESRVIPGVRVLVPLGDSRRVGVVVGRQEGPAHLLKDIVGVLDDHPLLDPLLLDFTRWVSDYYFAPWGLVLQAALPLELRVKVVRRLRLLSAGREALEHPFADLTAHARHVLDLLARQGDLAESRVRKLIPKAGPQLIEELARRGRVEILKESHLPDRRPRSEEWLRAAGDTRRVPLRGSVQRRVLDFLNRTASARMEEVCASAGVTPAQIRALARGGRIVVERREASQEPPRFKLPDHPSLVLTSAQSEALEEIIPALGGRGFRPFLLEGVTGSGKTEVYLRAAEAARERGLQTLYLVPEIGLTPLLAGELRKRFGESLAVLHSGLSEKTRWESLRRIREGQVTLVLGTRSALFAPLPRLGLIVVDEEQDPSYYQSESPRYHARDGALVRAKNLNAVVILGSATPSLEAVAASRKEKFAHLTLPVRVQTRDLPEVRLVDMREEFRSTGRAALLSGELSEAVASLRESGNQGMLLLNRRGYATFLVCRACGLTLACPSCAIALTYHRVEERLLCHYCNRRRKVPTACPQCGSQHLHLGGSGTQRLEEAIRQLDPDLRVGRLDRDSARGAAQAQILQRFQRRELDLLVGTQMLAKGHDFPGVTLVGILFADALLALPEFRAAERTYQLLTQMAGRAGRGPSPGRVIVQAYDIEHPALVAAATHRPEIFYERELRIRRLADYPPWVSLLQIRVEDRNARKGEELASQLAKVLRGVCEGRFRVLGPAPAPLSRLKGMFRRQILLKGPSRRAMAEGVRKVLGSSASPLGKIRRGVIVEPDPQSLL
jgi:primosomal protein N' (replication factor Y)